MANTIQISARQLAVLVVMITIGTTILIIPSGLAAQTKQDAWIAALAGTAINMLAAWLYAALGGRCGSATIVRYYERVFGTLAGRLLVLLFIAYAFLGDATVLFYMGNFINTQVMEDTPIQAVNILFAVIVVMGARLGLEAIVRSAEVLFPWILLLFFVLIGSLIPQIDMRNLQPVLEVPWSDLLRGGFFVSETAAFPLIVIFVFYPSTLGGRAGGRRELLLGVLIGSLFIVVITFMTIAVLGADITARQVYPSYALAKKIDIGGFFQRVEILIAAIWFITVYFKTLIYFYAVVCAIAQLMRLPDHKPLVYPAGMLLVAYSLVVYPNTVQGAEYDKVVWPPLALVCGMLIPGAAWCIDVWRSRTRRPSKS